MRKTVVFIVSCLVISLVFLPSVWRKRKVIRIGVNAPMSVIVLSFAAVSYYMPAFSPLVIRLLPSYPMLFAFRETLLDAIDLGYVYLTALGFSALAVVFFFLSNWRFKKTLTL